jgi:hypothetical protein
MKAITRIGKSQAALLCALLMAGPAQAQWNRATLPGFVPEWLTPQVGLTSSASVSEQRRNAKVKKAEQTKKKCGWPTEKEWNRCERVKTMPGQPGNCDHLLPKC